MDDLGLILDTSYGPHIIAWTNFQEPGVTRAITNVVQNHSVMQPMAQKGTNTWTKKGSKLEYLENSMYCF